MNGWRKKGGSQGGKQVERESEENEGRWEEGTQVILQRATYGFGTFYFNTGTWTNVKSVKCSSAWMPVARGLKLAMR